jgi:telomerase protein component 1
MEGTRQTVRVFISSTFRDMHAERDHLVTVVFPELRERVEQLGLELFDVDRRWFQGRTDELRQLTDSCDEITVAISIRRGAVRIILAESEAEVPPRMNIATPNGSS